MQNKNTVMKKIQITFGRLQSTHLYQVTTKATVELGNYIKEVKLVVCKEDPEKSCYVSLVQRESVSGPKKTFVQMFVGQTKDSNDYEFIPDSKDAPSLRTQPLGGPTISLETFASVIALELVSQVISLKEY